MPCHQAQTLQNTKQSFTLGSRALYARSQQVLVEGQSSTSAPVVSGVPQGTVLRPLLFLLYINDLPQKVSSTVRLFADESLLHLKISSIADTVALQRDMDRLQQWEEDWQMSFNPRKCEVVMVTKRRNPGWSHLSDIRSWPDNYQDREISGYHHLRGPLVEASRGCYNKEGKQRLSLSSNESNDLVWFDFCFTALRHILGHFGRGQLT